jgi:non-ribosomal peptide synthetase component F
MDRCWQVLVAYLAALKAGGAYMPLELVYPAELLSRVLENSKPKVVVTKEAFASRVPDWQRSLSMDGGEAGCSIPCPGNWRTVVRDAACGPLPEDVGATLDTRAYIVMTSGTTGVPKGICCPHRGSVFCYNWRRKHDPSRPGIDVEAWYAVPTCT